MQYYGTRLSENISRREPEGYLLCLNVPVARTGTQEYLPQELGLPTACGGNLGSPNFTRNKRSPQCGAAPIEGAGKGLPASPGPRNVIPSTPNTISTAPNVPPGTLNVIPTEVEESLTNSGLISVYRPEEEVFSPETIASFEGMPVTNDHPPDGVDIDNIRRLQMGHAHNVRRGSGEESDLLLADLIITDPRLIDLILSGKREISCGYNYELHEEEGQYIQRKIRGNHIAVVDAGRAGSRVSIKDRKPSPTFRRPTERRKTIMKKTLTKLLARMAKDGDIETVAEVIEELLGETSGEPETPAEAVAESTAEAAEAVAEAVTEAVEAVGEPDAEKTVVVTDEDGLVGVIERLDRLIALLTPAAPETEIPAGDEMNEGTAETGAAEEISEIVEEVVEAVSTVSAEAKAAEAAEEIEEMVEAILEPELSSTIGEQPEEDCGDPDKPCAGDQLGAALMAVRPALRKMSPEQRRKACADIARRLPRQSPNGADSRYAVLKARSGDYSDLGKRIMASRNPNFKK